MEQCRWFLLCANPADGVVKHPILGDVPTCRSCAEKHDLPLEEEFEEPGCECELDYRCRHHRGMPTPLEMMNDEHASREADIDRMHGM